MAPQLGSISDCRGRTGILLLVTLGALAAEILAVLVANFPDTISYRWLVLGALIDSLCGSFTTGIAIIYAYLADCTPSTQRTVVFGYFHACLFGGMGLGPLIAAFLLRKVNGNLMTIFYCAIAVYAIFAFVVGLIIPESLTKERQEAARKRLAEEVLTTGQGGWLRYLQIGNILAPFKILRPTGGSSSRHLRANLLLLAAIDFIRDGIGVGSMTVVVYYTGYQLGWEPAKSSLFVSICSIARVSVLLVVLPLFVMLVFKYNKHRERRNSFTREPEQDFSLNMLDLGILRFFLLLGYMGYALVGTDALFVLSGILTALGEVGSPALQSALTKHVPRDSVGQLVGVMGLIHALGRILYPAIFNLIYAGTVKDFPQAIFVVLASCFGVQFCLSWLVRPHILIDHSTTALKQPAASSLD